MAALDLFNLIQQCEQLLRMGQFETVQQKLIKSSKDNFSRIHLAQIGSLARRAHLWKLSLRWLHPIIRPQIKSDQSPSAAEIIEYAMALQKAGALNEAEKLLSGVDPNSNPKALLACAYGRMACWDYKNAKLLLQRYLQAKSLTDYERLVGRVNYAAALVFLKDSSAGNELIALEADLKRADYQLLLANCLEISAQYFISEGAYKEAMELLDRGENFVEREKNLDMLFIKKWRAIGIALKNNDTNILIAFRGGALKLQHWETLRDLDYYQTLIQPESFWADWCYYGTPHSAFRARMESIRPFKNDEWIFRSQNATVKIDPWFPKVNEGDLAHRCYVLLLKDLYRPLRVGEAFGALFSDEYYNPDSSPNRIHKAMNRMQKWLTEVDLPFQLVELDGSYSLRIPDTVQVLGRKQFLKFDPAHFFFHRYKSVLPANFTTDELVQITGVAKSSTQRMLKQAVDEKAIIKSGNGRYSTYTLSKKIP